MAVKVDSSWDRLLGSVETTVLGGGSLEFAEAVKLTGLPASRTGELMRIADGVRRRFASHSADLCSIVNARSGTCAEDCSFCAQSRLHGAGAPVYPMKSVAEIMAAARKAEAAGAHRFCIVTSGGALSSSDFEIVLAAVDRLRRETCLKRCASTGRLSARRAALLKQAGLNRYHHNIETAPSFFGQICSTHSYQDKLETIAHLKEAGVETCVGGILNLGETPAQRIEFAFQLRQISPDSVPVNFLIPVEGTPLGDNKPMEALKAARYLAIFRLILPGAELRVAGGRMQTFPGEQDLPFKAGANAVLIGDLLTTSGPDAGDDIALLKRLGFDTDAGC